jgi:hypothetical protein
MVISKKLHHVTVNFSHPKVKKAPCIEEKADNFIDKKRIKDITYMRRSIPRP